MFRSFGQEALRKEKLFRLSSSEAEDISGDDRRRRRPDDDDDDVDFGAKFSLVPSDSSNSFVLVKLLLSFDVLHVATSYCM